MTHVEPNSNLWRTAVLVALPLALLGPVSAAAQWPPWVERWLFNPTERTRRAVAAYSAGEVESAVEPFETALRLDRDHPVVQFNAGTVRLGAESGDPRELLEAAATAGPSDLAARARYNLGNALLASDELEGAIAAFIEALRQDPDLEAAKFNLELAQLLLEKQQEQQQEEGEQDREEEQRDSQPDPQTEQEPQQQEQQEQQEQQQQQQNSQPPPHQEQQQQQESPLPRFRDLPDMTAEEAAAILAAIENEEREQRRRQALEASRENAGGKKDW